MKRFLLLLMCLVLCLLPAGGGASGNPTYDYIIHLLDQGQYNMAIHVIEGMRDGKMEEDSPQPQQTPAPFDQVTELVPESNGSDWFFHMDVLNQSGSTLTLDTLLIRDFQDDMEIGTYGFEGEDLNRLPIGQLVLMPDAGEGWDDAHPVTSDFNRREYLMVFHTEAGEKYRISFLFDMRSLAPQGSETAEPSGRWSFPVMLENTTDSPWQLQAMDITNLRDGQPAGTFIFEGGDLNNIGLGGLVLEPGQQSFWQDGHPVVSDWNGREYRFHFVDENQQPHTLTFTFENLDEQNQPVDYSQDEGQDLQTLRHDAAFEVEVSPGVFWVPAAALGQSRYTNREIHAMLDASPEEKQANIATLYEAIQLYQVGNFTPSDDNVRIFEGEVNWEHHKPGYHAVRTNTGCCATDSNWLRYLLDGDYEEVGYIATSQRDGSGHIYNYIFHNGWYYIIDLTHYHAASPRTAPETPDMAGYYATDYILGNIHKVEHIQNYVAYVQNDFNDPPGMMFLYTAENCLAVDGARSDEGVKIIYQEDPDIQISVIFDDTEDSLELVRMPAPQNLPDWDLLP